MIENNRDVLLIVFASSHRCRWVGTSDSSRILDAMLELNDLFIPIESVFPKKLLDPLADEDA